MAICIRVKTTNVLGNCRAWFQTKMYKKKVLVKINPL